MPTQIQLRRGTYAQHQNFTGAVAEPTFDTSDLVLRIHDGVNAGGMEMVMGNSIYKGTPVKVVATANLTLYAVPNSAGSAGTASTTNMIINALPIPAGETVSLDQEKLVLAGNDTIQGFASSASALTFTISTLPV